MKTVQAILAGLDLKESQLTTPYSDTLQSGYTETEAQLERFYRACQALAASDWIRYPTTAGSPTQYYNPNDGDHDTVADTAASRIDNYREEIQRVYILHLKAALESEIPQLEARIADVDSHDKNLILLAPSESRRRGNEELEKQKAFLNLEKTLSSYNVLAAQMRRGKTHEKQHQMRDGKHGDQPLFLDDALINKATTLVARCNSSMIAPLIHRRRSKIAMMGILTPTLLTAALSTMTYVLSTASSSTTTAIQSAVNTHPILCGIAAGLAALAVISFVIGLVLDSKGLGWGAHSNGPAKHTALWTEKRQAEAKAMTSHY